MKIVEETSYGIIPLIYQNDDAFVFIVKHSNGNFWGFPKGHPDKGENSPIETAKRELKEEAGLDTLKILKEDPFVENYEFIRGDEKVLKTVKLFVASTTQEYQIDKVEVLDAKWVLLKDLAMHLTYKEAKSIAHKLSDNF